MKNLSGIVQEKAKKPRLKAGKFMLYTGISLATLFGGCIWDDPLIRGVGGLSPDILAPHGLKEWERRKAVEEERKYQEQREYQKQRSGNYNNSQNNPRNLTLEIINNARPNTFFTCEWNDNGDRRIQHNEFGPIKKNFKQGIYFVSIGIVEGIKENSIIKNVMTNPNGKVVLYNDKYGNKKPAIYATSIGKGMYVTYFPRAVTFDSMDKPGVYRFEFYDGKKLLGGSYANIHE